MHPSPTFQSDDLELCRSLVEEIGFGMIFGQSVSGPVAAHTPLHLAGENALQFHLAKGNALTKELDRQDILILANGPSGYISPRWYAASKQVPTWNYIAIEMRGTASAMTEPELVALLDTLSEREESQLAGTPWTRADMDQSKFEKMLDAIQGFSLKIHEWRPTFKLSQNKTVEDRQGVISALEERGMGQLAKQMRNLNQ